MNHQTPVPDYSEVQVATRQRPDTGAPRRARKQRRTPRWFVWLIGSVLGVVLLGLLACALVGGLLLGIAIKLANEATATDTSTRTFSVLGAPTLAIRNAAGKLTVRAGTTGTVTIDITRTSRDTSASAARDNLQNITVTTAQTGDQITLSTDFSNDGYFASANSVDLAVTVPPNTNITANVTAGNVDIDGVSGQMELTQGVGDASLSNILLADGSNVQVANGSVAVDGVIPAHATVAITVNTGDVTLRLPATTETRLDARTNVGDIHFTGWNLQPTRANSAGAVVNEALGTQPSGTVRIRVDSGDIHISQR
jgi:hypothetical protein